MQVVLTSADIDRMPPLLKRDLLAYLGSREGEAPAATAVQEPLAAGLVVLSRKQAVALVRELSFGARLRHRRDLLEALAYGDPGEAPSRDRLMLAAGIKDARQLRRELNAIRRLVQLTAHDPAAELTKADEGKGIFVVHPLSRRELHGVFAQLRQSGEGEEPAWA